MLARSVAVWTRLREHASADEHVVRPNALCGANTECVIMQKGGALSPPFFFNREQAALLFLPVPCSLLTVPFLLSDEWWTLA